MDKRIIVLFLGVMSFAMLRNAVLADFDAGQFAQNFNSYQFGGSTYTPLFYMRGSEPVFKVTDISSYGFNLNIGAYSPNFAGMVDPESYATYGPHVIAGSLTNPYSGRTWDYLNDDLYFSSFALGLTSWLPYECVGTLDYHNGTTRTSDGTAINLGIVYLYTKYATGTPYGSVNADNATVAELNLALQLLLSENTTTAQWEANPFLSHLFEQSGDTSVWLTPYDLNINNSPWLDNNYVVYVLNLTQFVLDWSGGGSGPEMRWDSVGDVLYLVQRDDGGTSGVPEPATVISWAAIGLGLFGAARYRKRRITDY